MNQTRNAEIREMISVNRKILNTIEIKSWYGGWPNKWVPMEPKRGRLPRSWQLSICEVMNEWIYRQEIEQYFKHFLINFKTLMKFLKVLRQHKNLVWTSSLRAWFLFCQPAVNYNEVSLTSVRRNCTCRQYLTRIFKAKNPKRMDLISIS